MVIKKEVCEGRYDGNVKLRVVTIVIEDVVLSWIATTKYEKEASCLKIYINATYFFWKLIISEPQLTK